jgi:hypothetical protein
MSTTATTHSTEPGALRWYRWLVWAGIASNIAVSIVSIIYPAEVLAFVGVDPATPLIWPRLAVMLLALLSIFYIPAALDPCAHRFSAIFAVVCRFAGTIFFAIVGGRYIPFSLFDFVFGAPQAICLYLGWQRMKAGAGVSAWAPRSGGGEPARRRVLSLEQLSVVHGAGRANVSRPTRSISNTGRSATMAPAAFRIRSGSPCRRSAPITCRVRRATPRSVCSTSLDAIRPLTRPSASRGRRSESSACRSTARFATRCERGLRLMSSRGSIPARPPIPSTSRDISASFRVARRTTDLPPTT